MPLLHSRQYTLRGKKGFPRAINPRKDCQLFPAQSELVIKLSEWEFNPLQLLFIEEEIKDFTGKIIRRPDLTLN